MYREEVAGHFLGEDKRAHKRKGLREEKQVVRTPAQRITGIEDFFGPATRLKSRAEAIRELKGRA